MRPKFLLQVIFIHQDLTTVRQQREIPSTSSCRRTYYITGEILKIKIHQILVLFMSQVEQEFEKVFILLQKYILMILCGEDNTKDGAFL